MTIRAAIVTPWVEGGLAPGMPGSFKPMFHDDYTFIRWEDVTGQPIPNIMPDPNEYTLVAEMEQGVFDTLAADPDYEVLWSEEVEVPFAV